MHATLVSTRLATGLPGGVHLRWRALATVIGRVTPVPCDPFHGCAAGCDLAEHRALAEPGDPFGEYFCPKLFRALLARLEANGTTVAVVTNIQLHRYARELVARGACRVVYDAHNVEQALDGGVGEVEGAVLEACDQAWLCSETDRTLAVRLYGKGLPHKAFVVPNAVMVGPDPPSPRAPEHVVYTARFDYLPNVDAYQRLVYGIAPLLSDALPGFDVVLAGAGLQSARNLPPNVRVVCDPPDITPLLAAGVLTVPLRLGGGTRFKILEAMALGTPVASTPKGAEGLACHDSEHLLLGETDAELVAAVARLVRDEPLRRKLCGNAWELVRAAYSYPALSEIVSRCLTSLGDMRSGIRNDA